MNPRTIVIVLAIIAALQHHLRALTATEDRIAPHFEIIGASTESELLPLKSTNTRVQISGVIAEVEISQSYANTGKAPIEAVYVFPGSTRAAIHGMRIKVGDRVLEAQIQEKAKARQTYQQAKSENKVATLLEQKRPNVFQMSVANIRPGAEVEVQLRYSEKLVSTERSYEFVLPGVVGPRYTRGTSGESWQSNPFLPNEASPAPHFDLALHIDGGLPIQSLTSPSHQLQIKFRSPTEANVSMQQPSALNRDLIVRYQLADKKINSGLLLHRGEDENFFLLNVQPPERITMEEVPARDYLFVVDVSGSMHGFPLDTTKQLMRELTAGLREKDKFNLLLFSGGSQSMSEGPLAATRSNINYAISMLQAQNGAGGTELLPALKHVLSMPSDDGRSRNIIVITDGYVDVEKEAFDLIRSNLNQASLFAFGIGSSVNRHLIEGLAHTGGGEAFIVTQPSEAKEVSQRFLRYLRAPLLTDIHVRAEGFDATDLEPASIPTLFADRPLEIVGKWKGEPCGRIIVTGQTAHGPYEASFDVATIRQFNNPALRPLWARERARILGDYASARNGGKVAELTALGLKYSLLTEHTSFVATDTEPQPLLATAATVKQPSPPPSGMDHGGAVPEPGVPSLMMLGLATLLLQRRR